MSDKQNTTSSQQTLQQQRAKHAWADVDGLKNANYRNEYGTIIRGLPAMILRDGLGHTLAFLQSKKDKPEHKAVYKQISTWVCKRLANDESLDLLEGWLLKKSSSDYRRATTEALAYVHWLKRFVEAKGWKSSESDNRG